MESILQEQKYIQDVYKEYLDKLLLYQNFNRQGMFIKYYNIDLANSIYDDKIESSYDMYNISDIKFNLYEMTPAFYIQPIVNRSTSVPDIKGQFFDSSSTIVLYSIESPKINDLISFYPPILSDEVMRVTNISTTTSAIYSPTNLRFFELELEYAPTKLNTIKLNQRFYYDLSIEKNSSYNDYVSKLSLLNSISLQLDKLLKFYNAKKDIYIIDGKVPIFTNELIIYLKQKFNAKYNRILEKYPTPYGYYDIVSNFYYKNISDIILEKSLQIDPFINSYKLLDYITKNEILYIPNNDTINDIINITTELIYLLKEGNYGI